MKSFYSEISKQELLFYCPNTIAIDHILRKVCKPGMALLISSYCFSAAIMSSVIFSNKSLFLMNLQVSMDTAFMLRCQSLYRLVLIT